jgi:8-hydroxy-5-deazaflavin:NADPH oxidoreductase
VKSYSLLQPEVYDAVLDEASKLGLPVDGHIPMLLLGTRPTVLIAGNDPRARETAAEIMFELGLDPWDAGSLRFSREFDAINVMNLIPAQQGRSEGYELKLQPSVPLSCFVDVSELFGFGRPYDLNELPRFPRRDPAVSCDEWRHRTRLSSGAG